MILRVNKCKKRRKIHIWTNCLSRFCYETGGKHGMFEQDVGNRCPCCQKNFCRRRDPEPLALLHAQTVTEPNRRPPLIFRHACNDRHASMARYVAEWGIALICRWSADRLTSYCRILRYHGQGISYCTMWAPICLDMPSSSVATHASNEGKEVTAIREGLSSPCFSDTPSLLSEPGRKVGTTQKCRPVSKNCVDTRVLIFLTTLPCTLTRPLSSKKRQILWEPNENSAFWRIKLRPDSPVKFWHFDRSNCVGWSTLDFLHFDGPKCVW